MSQLDKSALSVAVTPWLLRIATAAALVAAPSAHAVTLIDTVLAAIPTNVGSATYTTPQAPGVTLTVQETGSATMLGSDLFEYEGLWLGADGTGGRYTFAFNTPANAVKAMKENEIDVTGVLNAKV
jgi:hypothetical protein